MAGIARSFYYKWLLRSESLRELENIGIAQLIKQIHEEYPSKGYRRIKDDIFRNHGIGVNDGRVLRICCILGMRSNIKYCYDGCIVNDQNPTHTAENM